MASVEWGLNTVHLLAGSALFGMQAWVSFVQGPMINKRLLRRDAAKVLSGLFPKYFSLSSGAAWTLAATYYATRSKFVCYEVGAIGLLCILLPVARLFFAPPMIRSLEKRLYLEAEAGLEGLLPGTELAKTKLAKLKETNPEYKAACKRFGMLHGCTMLGNLVTLAATVFYIGCLSNRLS